MSRFIKEQLKSLRHNHEQLHPSKEWMIESRKNLLAQISNTIRPKSERQVFVWRDIPLYVKQAAALFMPQNILAFGRSALAVFMVSLLAVGGSIASVSASYDSLPGEPLYGVKLAAEKTELLVVTVVGDEKDRVVTHLRHASNRVDEFQKSHTPDQAKQAIQSLKKSITSANESLDKIDGKTASADVAQAINEKTDELIISLQGAPVAGEATNIAADTLVKKEVSEVTHLMEVTGVKAVEVLVESNLADQNNTDAKLDTVKQAVEKKLEKLVTDFSEISRTASSTISGITSSTAASALSNSTLVTSATSTNSSTTSTNDVNQAVIKATEMVAEANKLVEKTSLEAKTLIENNDLLGALKKVEVLSDVKKDTGTTAIEIKQISDSLVATSDATNTSTAPNPVLSTSTASVTSISTTTNSITNIVR